MSCSLGGPQSHGSPVVVFLDRGHPCFSNFFSIVPVHVVRVLDPRTLDHLKMDLINKSWTTSFKPKNNNFYVISHTRG